MTSPFMKPRHNYDRPRPTHKAHKTCDFWHPLCGSMHPPIYITAAPEQNLSSNGPVTCLECLALMELTALPDVAASLKMMCQRHGELVVLKLSGSATEADLTELTTLRADIDIQEAYAQDIQEAYAQIERLEKVLRKQREIPCCNSHHCAHHDAIDAVLSPNPTKIDADTGEVIVVALEAACECKNHIGGRFIFCPVHGAEIRKAIEDKLLGKTTL